MIIKPKINLMEVRDTLGHAWGFDRPLTRTELARALNLSEAHGGDYLSRVEKGSANIGGATEVAIRMMLDGALPFTLGDVIRAPKPRAPRRKATEPAL